MKGTGCVLLYREVGVYCGKLGYVGHVGVVDTPAYKLAFSSCVLCIRMCRFE